MNNTNGLMDVGAAPSTASAFVCLADVLGYSQQIRDANGDKDRLDELLVRTKAALGDAYARLQDHGSISTAGDWFAVRTFTDNVAVVCLVDAPPGDGELELASVLTAFIEHQARLAAQGFFVRGGLAFGLAYVDNDIVFGPPLLDAHEADRSGGPPRILLTDSAIALMKSHVEYYANKQSPYDRLLLVDSGGIFLNYLSVAFDNFPDTEADTGLLRDHKYFIELAIDQYHDDKRVLPKYQWLADYHNWVVERFAEQHTRIDPERADTWELARAEHAATVRGFRIDTNHGHVFSPLASGWAT